MGEYEEMCEKFGLKPGSEEDYDRLVEIMTDGGAVGSSRNGLSHEVSGDSSVHTTDASDAAEQSFKTFAEARDWAQQHPGRSFTRAQNGVGFQSVAPRLRGSDSVAANSSKPNVGEALPPLFEYRRGSGVDWRGYMDQLTPLSPQLDNILRRSSSNAYDCHVLPFSARQFELELRALSIAHVRRLADFLAMNIRRDERDLAQLVEEIRRDRRMRAGHYGEELAEALIELQKSVIPLLKTHLARRLDEPVDGAESEVGR
jgi:hypothetical protein